MSFITVSNKRYMVYGFHIKQPKPMIEFKLNRTIDENPNLIKLLGGKTSRPWILKHSYLIEKKITDDYIGETNSLKFIAGKNDEFFINLKFFSYQSQEMSSYFLL